MRFFLKKNYIRLSILLYLEEDGAARTVAGLLVNHRDIIFVASLGHVWF